MTPIQEQALALRGTKSYGLIAEELGVTRSSIAGIFFRHDNSGAKKNGNARRGFVGRAKECKPCGGKAGRVCPHSVTECLAEILTRCNTDSIADKDLRLEVKHIAERALKRAVHKRVAARQKSANARASL